MTIIKKMNRLNAWLLVLGSALVLSSCGSSEFEKTPLDGLIQKLDHEPNFTVVLYDMDVDGTMSSTYKHRYKVIREKADSLRTPYDSLTGWVEVSEEFFTYHEQDMGMEIATKVDGTLTKETSPPGYSRYVGNQSYGTWRTDSGGNSFWEFYGQYAFMSSMLGLVAGPVYRPYYTDYYSNYRGSRPYYGPMVGGSPTYGTLSSTVRTQNPDFTTG